MRDKVIDILCDFSEVEREKIEDDSNFVTDLGLSSLDVINLVVAFEEEFEIEIPDQKIRTLITVGDLIEYLQSNV